MPQDRIEAGLLADEHELGLAFEGPHLPGIAATPLFTETLGLVTAVDADPGPLTVRDLATRRLVLLSEDFATREHVDAYLIGHGVRPHIAVEANSVQALTEIVRRTELATVLPDAVTHDHPYLRPVPLEPALPCRTVTLLRRESAYESAAARAFTELTAHLVRERLPPRRARTRDGRRPGAGWITCRDTPSRPGDRWC